MLRIRPAAITALAAAAVALVGAATVPARAQVPNRLYGMVTLNGAAAAVGTTIVARTPAGQTCGQTTVTALQVSGTSYPYILDVPSVGAPPGCKPGAVLIFLVGGQTAGQTYTLDDLASFQRLDLTAPGTPNVPAPAGAVTLNTGCTDVTSTFPDGTPAATVAQAVVPAAALSGLWRYDAATQTYRGYSPAAPDASDLATVNRNDALRICVSAAASLAVPA